MKHFEIHFRERKKTPKISYGHYYPGDTYDKVQNMKGNTFETHLFRDQVLSSSAPLPWSRIQETEDPKNEHGLQKKFLEEA